MSGALLSNRKLDNVRAGPFGLFPFNNRLTAFGAPDEKDIDRHGEDKIACRDVHLPVDHFVFGNHPKPARQTHLALPTHWNRCRAIRDAGQQSGLIKWLMESPR